MYWSVRVRVVASSDSLISASTATVRFEAPSFGIVNSPEALLPAATLPAATA